MILRRFPRVLDLDTGSARPKDEISDHAMTPSPSLITCRSGMRAIPCPLSVPLRITDSFGRPDTNLIGKFGE